MRSVPRPPLRLVLVAGIVLASIAAPAVASAAPPSVPRGSAAQAPGDGRASLTRVAEVAADRLELADAVAAAKWGTNAPIEDPAREQAVLDEVAGRSAAAGVDPAEATAVFRDQIEASKLVQRGLHTRWEHHPAERPTTRPDLDEIRPVLDRITTRLLAALKESDEARDATSSCVPAMASSTLRVAHARHFDVLHGAGLARAVPSVCG